MLSSNIFSLCITGYYRVSLSVGLEQTRSSFKTISCSIHICSKIYQSKGRVYFDTVSSINPSLNRRFGKSSRKLLSRQHVLNSVVQARDVFLCGKIYNHDVSTCSIFARTIKFFLLPLLMKRAIFRIWGSTVAILCNNRTDNMSPYYSFRARYLALVYPRFSRRAFMFTTDIVEPVHLLSVVFSHNINSYVVCNLVYIGNVKMLSSFIDCSRTTIPLQLSCWTTLILQILSGLVEGLE